MSEAAEDYDAMLVEYARVDWVVFGNWQRLHHAVELIADPHEWCYRDVRTACGVTVDRAHVPGIFTRMGTDRCAHCCDRAGFPRGIGSPKNDDACRALLGLPPSTTQPTATEGGEQSGGGL